ncbi:MAG: hypothetical protein R2729_13070 [Bryobacteraceae bacterium]
MPRRNLLPLPASHADAGSPRGMPAARQRPREAAAELPAALDSRTFGTVTLPAGPARVKAEFAAPGANHARAALAGPLYVDVRMT